MGEENITAVYSPVVDSVFEVSLALHRTTTWRWRLAERHVRLTVRRLKQGDDDNDVARHLTHATRHLAALRFTDF